MFVPANLLREARRQKNLPQAEVPEICVLDPDGDIVRALRRAGRAQTSPGWACYHTELFEFEHGGMRFGIIGCAVGAAFAVLIAEELFASGCRFLSASPRRGRSRRAARRPISSSSTGRCATRAPATTICRRRDFAEAEPGLVDAAMEALREAGPPVYRGASWTTDAPFRETEAAIEASRARGILAVEMEAAALYAFARARGKPVLCLAHVTNQMAVSSGDFEKGEADGVAASLASSAPSPAPGSRRRLR